MNITVIDEEYKEWLKSLSKRFRQSQIKAAVKVNQEMLRFYWELGRDIVEMKIEKRWGEKVIDTLSADLRKILPEAHCFSKINLYYMKRFYLLYGEWIECKKRIVNQSNTEKEISSNIVTGKGNEIVYQVDKQFQNKLSKDNIHQIYDNKKVENINYVLSDLFSIPWGHHILILRKCSNDLDKALFYVRQTIENGWSRAMLLNFLDTDLYDREGKALTNFKRTLPEDTSELAQEITKDPYNFDFLGITKQYNERLLKEQLLKNITKFLLELGSGFAYVGREYRLQVGETEKFIDLLFYHLNLRCYVVIEVKITKFDFSDIGQIGGYVVAANHLLRKEDDNPTIGLLICKDKDSMVARYALESTNQPIAISEYELSKLYPKKIEGEIPSIEEIESRLLEDKEK